MGRQGLRFLLTDISKNKTESIDSSLVIRYRSGDSSCSVRFEINEDHLVVSFDGKGSPPRLMGEPLSPLEPRVMRSGQTIEVGKRQFALVVEPSETLSSHTGSDIWTEEYTRWSLDPSSDRALVRLSIQDRWQQRLADRGPSSLEAFVTVTLLAVLVNALLISRSEVPPGMGPSLSIAFWLASTALALALGARWALVGPPDFLGPRASQIPLAGALAGLFAFSQLSPGFLGLLFGPQIGFSSPLADRARLLERSLERPPEFVRFQTDWLESRTTSIRMPSSTRSASVPLASQPVSGLLVEQSGPQLLEQICSDPVSLSACYGFNVLTCRKMVEQQLGICAQSTAALGWNIGSLPQASSQYLACSLQAISESTGLNPGSRNCKEALNLSIGRAKSRDPAFPRPLTSVTWERFAGLLEESEAQYTWCGPKGILGGCSALLFEDCRNDMSTIIRSCLAISHSKRGSMTQVDLAISSDLIEESRQCILRTFEAEYRLLKAEPLCLRKRLGESNGGGV